MTLEQQIRDAHAAEQVEDRWAVSLSDIPTSYDRITDDWLTAVLCRTAPGARVTAHRLDAADDGTNNRRRIFVEYDAAGAVAGLPSSIFCKATHNLNNRLILGHSGAILGETIFFSQVRPLMGDIDMPWAWHAAYDPVSFNSIVVMNDLGSDVRFCDHDTPMPLARAESQIDLLAAYHGRFYGSPDLDGALAGLPTWHKRFNNLVAFHLEDACAQGFVAAEAVIPPELFARADEIWPTTLAALEAHKSLPLTLCHGDVHLKNWYIVAGDRMGLGDWGVAHRGHWSRDLAYAIATALTPDDRRAWERDLVARYLDRMRAHGLADVSLDQAMLWIRQALPMVLAFWTMTLKPNPAWPDMQPSETSMAFIGRIATAMADHASLDSL